MGKGLSPVQRQILGVAYVTREMLQDRGEAADRPTTSIGWASGRSITIPRAGSGVFPTPQSFGRTRRALGPPIGWGDGAYWLDIIAPPGP